jgi:type IV secretion system protein VirD4
MIKIIKLNNKKIEKNQPVNTKLSFYKQHKKTIILESVINLFYAVILSIIIYLGISLWFKFINNQKIEFKSLINSIDYRIIFLFILIVIVLEIFVFYRYFKRKMSIQSNLNIHGKSIISELNSYKIKTNYDRNNILTYESIKPFNLKNLNENLYRGYPVGSLFNQHTIAIDTDTQNHTLLLGSTGSGKTQLVVLPTIRILSIPIGEEIEEEFIYNNVLKDVINANHNIKEQELKAKQILKDEKIKKINNKYYKEKILQESMLITDPKGELYNKTYQNVIDAGYKVFVLNTLNGTESNSYNPLDLIFSLSQEAKLVNTKLKNTINKKDKGLLIKKIKELDELKNKYITSLAEIAVSDPTAKEKFWSESAKFSLIAYIYLIDDLIINSEYSSTKEEIIQRIENLERSLLSTNKDLKEEDIEEHVKVVKDTLPSLQDLKETIVMSESNINPLNITSILIFVLDMMQKPSSDKEKFENALDELFMNLDEFHPARLNYSVAKIAKSQTRASVLTVMFSALGIFLDPVIATLQATSQLDLHKLDEDKPIAIYCIVPDDDKSKHKIVSLFIEQVYQSLRYTARFKSKQQLIRRFNFILEEVTNVCEILAFQQKLSMARGSNIRFLLPIQNIYQLESLYGKEEAMAICNNCRTQTIILLNDSEEPKKYVERAGNKTILDSTSINYSSRRSNEYSRQYSQVEKPVLTVANFYELQFTQGYVFMVRYPVINSTFIPYFKILEILNEIEPNEIIKTKDVLHYNLQLKDLIILKDIKTNAEYKKEIILSAIDKRKMNNLKKQLMKNDMENRNE